MFSDITASFLRKRKTFTTTQKKKKKKKKTGRNHHQHHHSDRCASNMSKTNGKGGETDISMRFPNKNVKNTSLFSKSLASSSYNTDTNERQTRVSATLPG